MNTLWSGKPVTEAFERIVLSAAQILFMVMIALSVLAFVYQMTIGVTLLTGIAVLALALGGGCFLIRPVAP